MKLIVLLFLLSSCLNTQQNIAMYPIAPTITPNIIIVDNNKYNTNTIIDLPANSSNIFSVVLNNQLDPDQQYDINIIVNDDQIINVDRTKCTITNQENCNFVIRTSSKIDESSNLIVKINDSENPCDIAIKKINII